MRRVFVTLGVIVGLLVGLWLSRRYVEFLAFSGGEPFGKTEEVEEDHRLYIGEEGAGEQGNRRWNGHAGDLRALHAAATAR